jgi:signal transduction histidine kinase
LTSARGLLNVLHGKNRDVALNPFLDLMDESLMKMDERIDDVLEKGNKTFHAVTSERINLKSLLESILEDLNFMIHYARISISRKFLNNVPFASNEQLLRTILENIITNAIKYHNVEQANPTINITCMTMAGECAIEIVDNGLGMDTAYIENIFSRFYRIDATQAPGSGVGLHLVKESIDKLNGKISVMSRKGVGSNFLIRVPNLFEKKLERTAVETEETLTV